MAKVAKDHVWLQKEKLSGEKQGVRIVKAVQEEKDLILFIENDKLGKCALSIWGDNKNRLIDKYGDDTDNWANQKAFLHREESIDGRKFVILTC